MIGNAGGGGSPLDVVDVGFHEFLAAIFHRTDADNRRQRDDRAAHHRSLEIIRIIFGKSRHLFLKELHLLIGPRLEPFEPFLNVSKETGLGEFAVGDNVNAAIHLFAHHVADRLRQKFIIFLLIVGLPAQFRLHQIEQVVRPRQTPNMRGLNPVGILLDGHGGVAPSRVVLPLTVMRSAQSTIRQA